MFRVPNKIACDDLMVFVDGLTLVVRDGISRGDGLSWYPYFEDERPSFRDIPGRQCNAGIKNPHPFQDAD
jgi:hypothetical protein